MSGETSYSTLPPGSSPGKGTVGRGSRTSSPERASPGERSTCTSTARSAFSSLWSMTSTIESSARSRRSTQQQLPPDHSGRVPFSKPAFDAGLSFSPVTVTPRAWCCARRTRSIRDLKKRSPSSVSPHSPGLRRGFESFKRKGWPRARLTPNSQRISSLASLTNCSIGVCCRRLTWISARSPVSSQILNGTAFDPIVKANGVRWVSDTAAIIADWHRGSQGEFCVQDPSNHVPS